ncbi:MAG: undecaprenyldiphospho-muramoylpentapeptide beta-N-acetylglucosaminyltransferase [Oscillospiraceae bacterium]
MKMIIAAGGTGGHINPAIAVANKIKEEQNDAQILFIGTADKMESKLVPAAGFDFKTIDISGFQRKLSLENIKRNLKTLARLFKSSSQARAIIKEFEPDVVVGFGGYVSGPVLREAIKLKIPTAIHEQNAFPGVTNKTLAKKADRVMLTTEQAEKYIKSKNPCIITGLPVRQDMINANKEVSRAELGLDDRPMILSMGGSLGARAINDAVCELIAAKAAENDCVFIHAMGQYGLWVPDRLKELGVDLEKQNNVRIREYIDDMNRCMPAADLVICRAGASTLSELQALGKASILIPSPNVSENHQYHNAMALVNKQAAVIIEEKDLTGEKLISEVNKLLEEKSFLKIIENNAKKMAIKDATQQISKIIIALAQD